jgi:hypothetical protein
VHPAAVNQPVRKNTVIFFSVHHLPGIKLQLVQNVGSAESKNTDGRNDDDEYDVDIYVHMEFFSINY